METLRFLFPAANQLIDLKILFGRAEKTEGGVQGSSFLAPNHQLPEGSHVVWTTAMYNGTHFNTD